MNCQAYFSINYMLLRPAHNPHSNQLIEFSLGHFLVLFVSELLAVAMVEEGKKGLCLQAVICPEILYEPRCLQ